MLKIDTYIYLKNGKVDRFTMEKQGDYTIALEPSAYIGDDTLISFETETGERAKFNANEIELVEQIVREVEKDEKG